MSRCISNMAQIERRRSILFRQVQRVMFLKATIPCGRCRHFAALWNAYKCFYCGIWFCRACAQQHFS